MYRCVNSNARYRGTLLVPQWLVLTLLLICPAANAIQVELTTVVDRGLQPTIRGSCNLPDGMLVIVRVTRKESAFQFESRVEVRGGQFKVGPLLQGSSNVNPGTYNVEIVSVPPFEQPDSVKAAIGSKGDQLHGPFGEAGFWRNASTVSHDGRDRRTRKP
jgi:hypothetical protein